MTLTAVTLQGESKFDSTERSGFMLEPNDPEPDWGLCDHGPLLPADYRDDEEDYDQEWDEYGDDYNDDDESPSESLGRVIADIDARRGEFSEAFLREVQAIRHLASRRADAHAPTVPEPVLVHDGR
jgi:hypothetical protein